MKLPKGFGTAPVTDHDLLPDGDERAVFYRNTLKNDGPQTVKQLSFAWVEYKGVRDKEQLDRVKTATSRWIIKRAAKGEFVRFGDSGDGDQSLLYGYPEADSE